MRLITSLLIVITLVGYRAKSEQKIVAINFITNVPLVTEEGVLVNFGDTVTICFQEDLILYQIPYVFDSSKLTYHVKADSIEQENILTEKRYNFLVYKKGEIIGLWFKSISSRDFKKVNIDSILKKNSPPDNLYSILYTTNDSLIEKKPISDFDFVEKYVPKTKPDESYNDTTFLYYSKKMNEINNFSLSQIADSLAGAKLYKVRLLYNESYNKTYSVTMPRRELLYEIQEVKMINIDLISNLFRYYKENKKDLF